MLLRIANADVLPYDYSEYAKTMRRYLPSIERAVSEHRWNAPTTALPCPRISTTESPPSVLASAAPSFALLTISLPRKLGSSFETLR